jgi:hypothetical protein
MCSPSRPQTQHQTIPNPGQSNTPYLNTAEAAHQNGEVPNSYFGFEPAYIPVPENSPQYPITPTQNFYTHPTPQNPQATESIPRPPVQNPQNPSPPDPWADWLNRERFRKSQEEIERENRLEVEARQARQEELQHRERLRQLNDLIREQEQKKRERAREAQ